MDRLTQKQFVFCLKYIEFGNASEAARLANYSPKTAAVIGRENLLKPKIQKRIDELRQKIEDESVTSVLERKQVLTEIIRARLSQFDDVPTQEQKASAGLAEIKTVSLHVGKATEKNSHPPTILTTTIKLHSPIQAIDLLNKMDKLYTDGATVNVDNRTLIINVNSEKAKGLTERLIAGEGTSGNNDHTDI